MRQAISEVLPFAVGVAISPVPIIAVILMLFSSRAKVNGPSFLLGWVLGLSIVVAIVYAVSDASDVSTDSSASDGSSTIQLVLGVLLVLLAVPVVFYLLGGQKAKVTLDGWKAWLWQTTSR